MPFKTYEFPLIKAEATGNDFLLVDLLNSKNQQIWLKEFAQQKRPELFQKWCARYTGLGADGVVVLEEKNGVDFKWDFYNSDGSAAEMCGNAARAVSLWVNSVSEKKQLNFETKVGVIRSTIHSADEIEVELPAIAEEEWDKEFDFVRAGVPHAVVHTKKFDDVESLTEKALSIKKLSRFKRDGTNVTFVRKISDSHIEAKTFERGVEGFTKSCGTGAIAAAHAILRGDEGRAVQVDVPGGRLYVIWKQGKPVLTGPARIVGEMRWRRE